MATLVLVVALVATSPPWPRGEEAPTNTNSLHPFVESADGSRIKLSALNIDPTAVVTAGLGDSADFAHQFHIAFSRTVSGACVFSGQVKKKKEWGGGRGGGGETHSNQCTLESAATVPLLWFEHR